MNDRFKFRCFNPEDKTMHYTDFVITATGFTSRLEAMNDNNRIFYIDNENLDMDKKLIVMQCTGLKDKNGKLIFEGDIIRFYCDSDYCYEGGGRCEKCNDGELYTIDWIDEQCKFVAYDLCGNDYMDLNCDALTDIQFEIIGNIYENPKLLENNS